MTHVDKYYRMNPETDDVLANGNLLQKGMKVLVGDPNLRENYEDEMSLANKYRYDKFNRWSTIDSDVHFFKKPNDFVYVSFVALYEDGAKMPMHVATFYPWLIKKDTIPAVENILVSDTEAFNAGLKKVKNMQDAGYSMEEIAQVFGVSAGYLRFYINRQAIAEHGKETLPPYNMDIENTMEMIRTQIEKG